MELAAAQAELRRAHVNGGAGVLVSGLAWLGSGLVWATAGPKSAFVTLFFAGMAITPLAQALTRLVFKAPPAVAAKRLEAIAVITVPILLAGFYAAWRWVGVTSELAIPVVAVAVGLRYLAFPLMFGTRVFFALGAVFIVGGGLALASHAPPIGNLALALGLVELGCGAVLCRQWRATPRAG